MNIQFCKSSEWWTLDLNGGYFVRDGGRALLLLYGGHLSSAARRVEDIKDSTLLEVHRPI